MRAVRYFEIDPESTPDEIADFDRGHEEEFFRAMLRREDPAGIFKCSWVRVQHIAPGLRMRHPFNASFASVPKDGETVILFETEGIHENLC
jgi:hypothetical protein